MWSKYSCSQSIISQKLDGCGLPHDIQPCHVGKWGVVFRIVQVEEFLHIILFFEYRWLNYIDKFRVSC